jgi:N-acetylglucosamine kinase-like BadF-type ATPase
MNTVAVLAVDAGGTSSRAALSNSDGTIVGYAEGGPCNYQSIGLRQALANLTSVLQRLTDPSNQGLVVEQAVIGIAGLDTSRDRAIIEELVQKALLGARIHSKTVTVHNDGMMTLLGSVGDGSAVLVSSGTGSIVLGKTKDGRQTRVGGWGHRIGDDGSGFAIGQAALRHVFRAVDGCDPPSGIQDALLKELQLDSVADLMAWIYSDSYSVDRVAGLAPVVFQLAHARDETAFRILRQAGNDLASACSVAIEHLGLDDEPFDLVIAGSILQKDTLVCDAMMESLSARYSTFHVVQSIHDPIYSAIVHGLRTLNCASETAAAHCADELRRWQQRTATVFNPREGDEV